MSDDVAMSARELFDYLERVEAMVKAKFADDAKRNPIAAEYLRGFTTATGFVRQRLRADARLRYKPPLDETV